MSPHIAVGVRTYVCNGKIVINFAMGSHVSAGYILGEPHKSLSYWLHDSYYDREDILLRS